MPVKLDIDLTKLEKFAREKSVSKLQKIAHHIADIAIKSMGPDHRAEAGLLAELVKLAGESENIIVETMGLENPVGVKEAKKMLWKKIRQLRKHIASEPGQPPHVKTGRLRESFEVTTISDGRVLVGPEAYYGYMLEHGTSKMKARPFMGPALEKVKYGP